MNDYMIWDWNGTLFDDLDVCFYCINRLLYNHGYKPLYTYAEYKKVFCFPIKQYYQNAGFDFSKIPYETLADEYMRMYLPLADNCRLNKDALCVIDELNNRGVKQVILTASKKENLLRQLSHFDITDKFDMLLATDNHYCHSKLQLAESFIQNAKDARNIYFIGDSLHDAEVAKAMGAKIFLHTCGHQSLSPSSEYTLLNGIKEVLEYIK